MLQSEQKKNIQGRKLKVASYKCAGRNAFSSNTDFYKRYLLVRFGISACVEKQIEGNKRNRRKKYTSQGAFPAIDTI